VVSVIAILAVAVSWGQPLTVSIVCIASALVFIWNERRKKG